MITAPCLVCGSTGSWTVWRLRRDPYLEQLGLSAGNVRKVMCRRCGLVYSRPQLDADEIARLYDGFRESATPGERHLAAKQRLAADDYTWVQARLGHAAGDVLDIGCAEGSFLRRFQQDGWRCIGIEPSAFALFARDHYGLEVHRAVFEAVPLPPDRFDLVTALRVLEHVGDPRDVLGRIRGVLRPTGQLYLEVPDASRPRHRLAEFLGVQHLRLFTASSLSGLLESAGFLPVTVDASGRGLRALARVAAAGATPATPPAAPVAPTRADLFRLRGIYARHHVRYFWKVHGRTALVAAARRGLGATRLHALRRWIGGSPPGSP